MQREMWKSASRSDVTCRANLVTDNVIECSLRRKVRAERSENHYLCALVMQIRSLLFANSVRSR